MATSTYAQDADGTKFIPATQRPDGSWRKPRRVKDGYVPQEEVPLYESKGKQIRTRQNTGIPVGLTAEIVASAQKKKPSTVEPIPGMIINVANAKKKKKKKSAVEDATDKLNKCVITEPTFTEPAAPALTPADPSSQDPAKRLKNLRKKLREIEILEEKVKSGALKNPDKDQREKMTKKEFIIKEISGLELLATT